MWRCYSSSGTHVGHSSHESTENGVQSIQTVMIQRCSAKTLLMTTRQQSLCSGIFLQGSGGKYDHEHSWNGNLLKSEHLFQGSALWRHCKRSELSKWGVVGFFWIPDAPQHRGLSWKSHKKEPKGNASMVNCSRLKNSTIPLEEGPHIWGGDQDPEWMWGCLETLGL